MKKRSWSFWLAAPLSFLAACGGGKESAVLDVPWQGARALSAREDLPTGLAVAGTDVLYTTGRTQAGDHAVRAAPLEPASPPASRIVVADPDGSTPNGPLAVDDAHVYVAAGRGIKRVSLATGEATPVVDSRPAGVTSVAVDDTYVWWTTSEFQSPLWAEVARIPKGGGPVEILASGTDPNGHVYQDDPARQAVALTRLSSALYSIVLDGGAAFVPSPGGILRVVPSAKPQVVVDDVTLGGSVTRIAVDADRFYGEIAGGNLFSVPRTGGHPTKLAANPDDTMDVAVAGDQVIFMSPAGDGGKEDVNAVPTTGGASRTIASGRYAGGELVVTGALVVFIADGRVWSAPLG